MKKKFLKCFRISQSKLHLSKRSAIDGRMISSSSSFFLAFGIPSGPDLIILLLIVLVLFGAKRLPEIARSLGQSVHEFKKAKQEFDEEVSKPITTAAPPQAPLAESTVSQNTTHPPQA